MAWYESFTFLLLQLALHKAAQEETKTERHQKKIKTQMKGNRIYEQEQGICVLNLQKALLHLRRARSAHGLSKFSQIRATAFTANHQFEGPLVPGLQFCHVTFGVSDLQLH